MVELIVKAWSNGSPNNQSGSGYGIRISREDRDKYFQKNWESVVLRTDAGNAINIRLSPSFWKSQKPCSELRSAEIGLWLIEYRLAPWQKGKPPTLKLEPTARQEFRLTR